MGLLATGKGRPSVPGGGGGLGSKYVCVQKGGTLVLFWLQGSEMSENISFKMGTHFVTSLNIGKNLC